MKTSKKMMIIIVAISIFLISDIIRVSANTSKDLQYIGLNSESLVEYINNLDINKEEIEEIVDKGKKLSENIKDKTSIKDYKINELLGIYKDITKIANNLNLNIDFNFKDGAFNLKEKNKSNIIFSGNINNLGKYFQFYKNNIQLFTSEVLGNIDNKEIIENIEEVVEEELGGSKETINNSSIIHKSENENDVSNKNYQNELGTNKEEKDSKNDILESNKGNPEIIFAIFIIFGAFFTIMASYIKFKK